MRVFIVEDCEIFRLSLMLVLAQESDIEVVLLFVSLYP